MSVSGSKMFRPMRTSSILHGITQVKPVSFKHRGLVVFEAPGLVKIPPSWHRLPIFHVFTEQSGKNMKNHIEPCRIVVWSPWRWNVTVERHSWDITADTWTTRDGQGLMGSQESASKIDPPSMLLYASSSVHISSPALPALLSFAELFREVAAEASTNSEELVCLSQISNSAHLCDI